MRAWRRCASIYDVVGDVEYMVGGGNLNMCGVRIFVGREVEIVTN